MNAFFCTVVPPSPLEVSTTVDGSGIAGEQYSATCSVIVRNAGLITNDPQIIWSNPSGDEVAGMGITMNDNGNQRTIQFDPLRTSLAGLYTCTASLESPAVEEPLIAMATRAISVAGTLQFLL